jgi:serine/threonine protein phosphatase PrpC
MALRDGDVLALCSDGVWGPVSDQGMLSGLNGGDVMKAVPLLMDRAEQIAGPSCDNLSLIAVCWHDESTAAHNHSISTQTMAVDDFTTQLDTFERTHAPTSNYDITDDEIETAISEINQAIQKFSK